MTTTGIDTHADDLAIAAKALEVAHALRFIARWAVPVDASSTVPALLAEAKGMIDSDALDTADPVEVANLLESWVFGLPVLPRHEFVAPFPGFSDTRWGAMLDHAVDRMALKRSLLESVSLEVARNDVWDSFDHATAMLGIAKHYVSTLAYVLKDLLDPGLKVAFAGLSSPKDYTYRNDRIFAAMDAGSVLALFKLSASEGHETLARLVRSTYGDRSGWAGHYSSEIADWLVKPVLRWDWNELPLLVQAAALMQGLSWADIDDLLHDAFVANGGASHDVFRAISSRSRVRKPS